MGKFPHYLQQPICKHQLTAHATARRVSQIDGATMYEGPEFRHLTTFVTIGQCNFGKAAERLHVAQPALSSHIKHLEEGLQEQLFKRVPHGAELTEAGRNFLPYARHILHLRTHAMRAASRRHSEDDLPLRLGYSPS